MNETIKNLVERRSVRAYSDRQVEDDKLNEILKAGAYAPTGMGKQSPVMVVVRDKEMVEKLEKINAKFTKDPESHPFYGAPTVIVVFYDSKLTHLGMQDASLCLGNLMNAAYSLGEDSCWINRATESFKTDDGIEIMKKWGLDESYVAVGNCILGYRSGDLPEAKPRKEGYVIWDK